MIYKPEDAEHARKIYTNAQEGRYHFLFRQRGFVIASLVALGAGYLWKGDRGALGVLVMVASYGGIRTGHERGFAEGFACGVEYALSDEQYRVHGVPVPATTRESIDGAA